MAAERIDEIVYAELLDAKDKLCGYCESDDCEKCTVTRLVDDATADAIEAGIITDD